MSSYMLLTRIILHTTQYLNIRIFHLIVCWVFSDFNFSCFRFLEEYRMLQKELTKMKETCVTLCQEKDQVQVTPVTPLTPSSVSSKMVPSTSRSFVLSPNSNKTFEDSKDFRNFENELSKYLIARNISSSNFQTDV